MRTAGLLAALVFAAYAVPTIARIGFAGPNGFRIDMNASVDPGGEAVPSGISEGSEGRFQRFVLDRDRQRYFAYDLVVVASGPDRLQVRVEALSLSAAELAKVPFVDRSWTAVPMLTPPVIPEVKAGDRVVVDLLPNPTAGPRVIDNIVFARP